MTFCVAFAGPRFAFLAADTRGWIPDDSGPPRVVDNVRKLSPLPGGWAVTGNRVDVSAIVMRSIADCSAADTAGIAARLASIRPALLQMIYNQPARDVVAILSQPTAVWIVAADTVGFTCRRVDWLTGEVAAHEGVCVMPLGADPTETALLVSKISNALEISTRVGYLSAMRRMATRFHDVADRLGPTGAVSDVVEIGALWRDDAGQVITEHLPPTATESVRRASDVELEALLAQSVVVQVGMLKAIAAVAGGLAQMMVGNASAEIAQAIAHPLAAGQHLAAAAKFFGAAAIFGALSGALSGAAANTAGGGGGAGGTPNATTAAAATDKGGGTIVIYGGLLDMSQPDQADALGKAITDLTGRGIVIQAGSGA